MAYNFDTTPERSSLMKRIKGQGTQPEQILRKAIWTLGYRYRKNYTLLPGKPDIALIKYKVAIFIDGEFWHGYNWKEKKQRIKANRDYWITKIERNMERDKINTLKLEAMGFTVLRFWEKEVNKELDKCIQIIEAAINKS